LLGSLFSVLFFVRALAAQQNLPPPPDFSQDSIIRAAEEVSGAWSKWKAGDADLEQRIYRLPMAEARVLLQRSLGRYLDFIEGRRAYSEAVVNYMETSRLQPRPNQPVVTMEAVYRDHIELLGVNLAVLQQKLDALRASNDWVAIRRAVQPERTATLALQSSRRDDMPLDFSADSPDHPASPSAMPALAYRDAESKLMEAMEKLWTRYYQALADAVEQKTSGSAPLTAMRGSGDSLPPAASGAPAAPPAAAAGGNPVAGSWTYVQGSQQFNGVGEPKEVLLELWVENGMLMGRYRAELPDFQGTRKVDIRLHGPLAAGNNQQTLDFESKDPEGAGKVALEYNPTRRELMFVRPSAQTILPRGREVLHPR
jgi:hypothetical protein